MYDNSINIFCEMHVANILKTYFRVHSRWGLQGMVLSLPSWWKTSTLQPFYPDQTLRHTDMCLHTEKLKNQIAHNWNSHHTLKILLYVKYGNSPKLCPKAMKPALKSSFYLKIRNELQLFDWYVFDDRILIQYAAFFQKL